MRELGARRPQAHRTGRPFALPQRMQVECRFQPGRDQQLGSGWHRLQVERARANCLDACWGARAPVPVAVARLACRHRRRRGSGRAGRRALKPRLRKRRSRRGGTNRGRAWHVHMDSLDTVAATEAATAATAAMATLAAATTTTTVSKAAAATAAAAAARRWAN